MVIGYVGGLLLSLLFIKRLLVETNSKIVNYATVISFGLGIIPAIFIGTVVGGNFGGAWFSHFSEWSGISINVIPIGVAIGLITIIPMVMFIFSIVGYFISSMIIRFINNETTT